MSRRLDPNAPGASVTLGVRFDSAALAVIDHEARRLEALTGEVCDRSRALRSIVRRFGAELETSAPSTPPKTSAAAPSPARAIAVAEPADSPEPPRTPRSPRASTARSSKTSTRGSSKTSTRGSSKTSTAAPSPARAAKTSTPEPESPRGRWAKVSAADLRQLARDLAALSAADLRACIDGANVARSQVYSARNGKAGEPTYRALRAWLDTRRVAR